MGPMNILNFTTTFIPIYLALIIFIEGCAANYIHCWQWASLVHSLLAFTIIVGYYRTTVLGVLYLSSYVMADNSSFSGR